MNRILCISAIGATVITGLFVYVVASALVVRGDWQSWAFLVFVVLGVSALDAGALFRLFRSRTDIRSFADSRLNPLIPRSKYAVWNYSPHRAARLSAVGAKKRKALTKTPGRV